jgi:competence protein ComEC
MLDVVVLTHPAEPHYQGLIPVLEDFIVGEFWWSGEARGGSRGETAPESWIEFERAMERAQEKVLLRQGDGREFEQVKVKVLNAGREHPNTSRARDINNDSIVLMLKYNGTKVLFAGDIEEIEGQDMVDDYCGWFFCRKLNVDIVKAAHHGSGHYSSKFLRTVDAEYVILSTGFQERESHHPRSSALQAYEEYGAIEFYSTGLDDITGNDNIVITIGPERKKFVLEGAASGFTYWRDMDDDRTCEREVDQGFCLEIWE